MEKERTVFSAQKEIDNLQSPRSHDSGNVSRKKKDQRGVDN